MWIFRRWFQAPERGKPDVIVDFSFDQGLLYITVSNIGAMPAYRVSITFDQEIWGLEGEKLVSEISLFRKIEFIPPSKQITAFLDASASYFNRGQPTEVETHVVFQDRRGRRYTNTIQHDLNIYRDLGYVQRKRSETDEQVSAGHP